jgi:acyl-CoA synthetase (AMP-forming)/AMP-acid ligase II
MSHAPVVRAWVDWCSLVGLRRGDRYLIVSPFSHVFGYKAGCLAAMISGAAMLPVAVFDAAAVLDLVEREKVTVLPGPPTLYHLLLAALLTAGGSGGRDLSSLRLAVTGAADSVPDERLGQVGAAFVVRSAADAATTEAELIGWCRPRIAGYKVPRSVEFVAELPVNAAGKVDKSRLSLTPERTS